MSAARQVVDSLLENRKQVSRLIRAGLPRGTIRRKITTAIENIGWKLLGIVRVNRTIEMDIWRVHFDPQVADTHQWTVLNQLQLDLRIALRDELRHRLESVALPGRSLQYANLFADIYVYNDAGLVTGGILH